MTVIVQPNANVGRCEPSDNPRVHKEEASKIVPKFFIPPALPSTNYKLYTKYYKDYWASQMAQPTLDRSFENLEEIYANLIGMLSFENFPDIAAKFDIVGSKSRILIQAFTSFIQRTKITLPPSQYSQKVIEIQGKLAPLFAKHLSFISAMHTISYFKIPYMGEPFEWIKAKVKKRLGLDCPALFSLGSLPNAPLSGHIFYAISYHGQQFSLLRIVNATPAANDSVELTKNLWEVDCARELIYFDRADLMHNLLEAIKFRLPHENEKEMKIEFKEYEDLKRTNPERLSTETIQAVSIKVSQILQRNAEEDEIFSNRHNPLKRFHFTQGISCSMAPLRAILYIHAQHEWDVEQMPKEEQEKIKCLLDFIYLSFKMHCYEKFKNVLKQSPNYSQRHCMLNQAFNCLQEEHKALTERFRQVSLDQPVLP